MANHPSWQSVKDRFAWDGSWRDVYVLDTTRADWEKFVDFIAHSSCGARVRMGASDIDVKLPEKFPDYAEDEQRPMLSFDVAGVSCNCHFFWDKDIEFDIDPRELRGDQQYEDFMSFLGQIRDLLRKDVLVTEENTPENVIVRLVANQGWTNG
jgi:hypothetical protein